MESFEAFNFKIQSYLLQACKLQSSFVNKAFSPFCGSY